MANPPKKKVQGGRVTPKGTRPAGSYDNATVTDFSGVQPSPKWVPVLMFTLLALGILVIFFNYVGWLPGGVNNGFLLLGLGLILGGIITATQYR